MNSEDFFIIPVEKGGHVSMNTLKEYRADARTMYYITEANGCGK